MRRDGEEPAAKSIRILLTFLFGFTLYKQGPLYCWVAPPFVTRGMAPLVTTSSLGGGISGQGSSVLPSKATTWEGPGSGAAPSPMVVSVPPPPRQLAPPRTSSSLPGPMLLPVIS